MSGSLVTPSLVAAVLDGYALDPEGVHGVVHWARVLENGRTLAPETGARLDVVELFALFHDARRENDGHDPGHGLRGARLAETLRDRFGLDDEGFRLLFEACSLHTNGGVEGDVTVRTCYDADRLDLMRVGIRPRPERLATAAARRSDTLRRAIERSLSPSPPAALSREWGLDPSRGFRRRREK